MVRTDFKNRKNWLKHRPLFIGASESPGLLGEGYHGQGAYALYAEKALGVRASDEATEAMEVGLEMQPVIARLFEKRTKIKVIETPPYEVVFARDRPFIGATLDGLVLVDGEQGIFEAKNVGEWTSAEWDAPEPPLRVQIQVQHQLLCTGLSFGYAAALLGGNRLKWRRIPRHDPFIVSLTGELKRFWSRVDTKTPPPVDGSEATAAALKRMYPKHREGQTISLPAKFADLDRNRVHVKASISYFEAELKEYDNEIKAALGDAEEGVLPAGAGSYTFRYQKVEHKARAARTSGHRVLRRKKGEHE